MNKLHRQAKQIKTAYLKAHPEEIKTLEDRAWVDNDTPGPGLRNGKERKRHDGPGDNGYRQKKDDEGENNDGKVKTGWGGFPLPESNEVKKEVVVPAGKSVIETLDLSAGPLVTSSPHIHFRLPRFCYVLISA
jgi:hypothetical protein